MIYGLMVCLDLIPIWRDGLVTNFSSSELDDDEMTNW